MASNRRRHRITLVVFVVIAAGACLALGYWQWSRYESVGGTGRNLGYALQWPLFAAFFIYAYRRFVALEGEQASKQAAEQAREPAAGTDPGVGRAEDAGGESSAPDVGHHGPARGLARLRGLAARRADTAVTAIPADLLPQRPSAPAAQHPSAPAAQGPSALAEQGTASSGTARGAARPGTDRRPAGPDPADRADPALAEYNDYLARLHERDTKGRR